jgi:hypothetical protein
MLSNIRSSGQKAEAKSSPRFQLDRPKVRMCESGSPLLIRCAGTIPRQIQATTPLE